MKTLRITVLLGALSVVAGVAMAQPAETTGSEQMRPRGERRGMMDGRRGDAAGPYMKLAAASRLESLSEEQKTKVNALLEESKTDAQAMREEMKTAAQAARNAADREARRAAMEPIRQKHQAAQQKIDAALANILTPAQMTELNQKTAQMQQKMRDGRRGADDGAPKAKDGKRKDGARNDGDRKGRRGKRGDKAGAEAGSPAAAASTTGTQTVNPFAVDSN